LPYEIIQWTDRELLLRVIEERLVQSTPLAVSNPSDIWHELFESSAKSVPEHIFRIIQPRPRDLIFLVNRAIEAAVSRAHEKVKSEDMFDAWTRYSKFAFDALRAECEVSKYSIDDVFLAIISSGSITET